MIKIYEIQSAALADGAYNCYEQCLLASAWGAGHGDKFKNAATAPVSVEVFNLLESETVSGYSRALATGDRMMAWEITDCSGEARFVGRPVTPDVRRAKVTEAPDTTDHITCNLYANDGATEVTSGLGSAIEAYFEICFGTALNAATPKLQSGDDIFVVNLSGKWWCVTTAQKRTNCTC